MTETKSYRCDICGAIYPIEEYDYGPDLPQINNKQEVKQI